MNYTSNDQQETNYQDPSEVNKILEISCPIMLVMYLILLSAVVYNTFRFVYKDDKYKNFYISYFYLLVYIIVAARMTWLVLLIWVASHYEDGQSKVENKHVAASIFYIDIVATYAELLTGI